MNLKIFWKLALSALFLAYAVWRLTPLTTTPFDQFVEERIVAERVAGERPGAAETPAAVKAREFRAIYKEAQERVKRFGEDRRREEAKQPPLFKEGEKSQTIYAALRDIGAGKGSTGKLIDLCQYFPDIQVVDDPNIPRRNGYLLQELLLQSQGKLKLGLDLQGGVSFTLSVDPKNFEPKEEDIAAARKTAIREATRGLTDPASDAFKQLPSDTARAEAKAKWDAALAKADAAAVESAKELASAAKTRLQEGLEKAISVMEGRVNEKGVAEPIIRVIGTDRIEIQLPGGDAANDPNIIEALKKPAKLEFRMCHRYLFPEQGTPEHSTKPLKENPKDPASPILVYEVLYQRREVKRSEATDAHKAGDIIETPYYVAKTAVAGGNIVKHASPSSPDGFGYQTSISFTSDGAKKFEKLTGDIAAGNNAQLDRGIAVGTRDFFEGRMAIVLDGKLVLAPGVKISDNGRYRAIAGGGASIDAENLKAAQDLANVLNNPLEFPLKLEDSKQISATLAADAKEKSVTASGVAIGLVVVFMLLYYVWAGAISVAGLVLNVVLMLGVMAAFGATITLPGVAALVLTIGMAVDANILVFERVREEMSAGKPLRVALREGYDAAQATIIDANLTTLMSAVILIFMGTGPIKGFGVILAIGIITTVFTVLVTCRALQELCVNLGVRLPIFGVQLFKGGTKIPFLQYAKPSFIASWLLVIFSLGALIYKGGDAFSKDFKGGEAAIIKVAKPAGGAELKQLDAGTLIKTINAAGVNDVTVSYQTTLGGTKDVTLRVETELSANVKTDKTGAKLAKPLAEFTQVRAAVAALQKAFPGHFVTTVDARTGAETPVVDSWESIGGAVSGSLQQNAIVSMLLALLGIAIYVALRFETGMGLGALVSSLHDVLLTAGLYILVGKQFSSSMIAAILMVIGYSINDTIVVFDRIREEMKRHPGATLRDIIHISINKTLSRTLLTSVTVFLCAAALYTLGAGDVKEYGLIFIFGVLTGTFSSIFIASPIFYWWHKGQRGSVEKAEAQVRYEWEAGAEVKRRRRDPLEEIGEITGETATGGNGNGSPSPAPVPALTGK